MDKPSKFYTVAKPDTLLPFLLRTFADKSRTTVKSLLTHRRIAVNGLVTSQHDAPLAPGDRVTVNPGRSPEVLHHPKLRILHEDEHLIVIDKRNGLLSMGTDREKEKTAYHILSEHVKRSDPMALVFIVHRLDRETSGLMLVAKSEQVQQALQRNWGEAVTRRRYVAVVESRMPQPEGVIDAPLAENKNFKVYVPRHDEEAVDAQTAYRVLREGRDYSLVELELRTGRKNQIRAHLEHIGNPVAGDKKYGASPCRASRICLHASSLHFIHPVTGIEMQFDLPIPQSFEALV